MSQRSERLDLSVATPCIGEAVAQQAADDCKAQWAIPEYLRSNYWWAYVHPRAVRIFDRAWLVDLILFGNYGPLRDRALAEFGSPILGRCLQVACVYGDLTERWRQLLDVDASLDVVDILPVQLRNLRAKLPCDDRLTIRQDDAVALHAPDGSYDNVLLFFLLHEQPDVVRRATLAEAVRVLRPGGKLVIVDYHRPAPWHPLRPLLRLVFGLLEPYAIDLWRQDIEAFLPTVARDMRSHGTAFFGGVYRMLVIER